MKKIINKLNNKLRVLKKKERMKELENYREIFQENAERGLSAEKTVSDFGGINEISEKILDTYSYKNLKISMFQVFIHYFNKIYIFADICIILLTTLIVYGLYYVRILEYVRSVQDDKLIIGTKQDMMFQILIYLGMILLYPFINYLVRLYTIEIETNVIKRSLRIVISNLIMILLWVFSQKLFNDYGIVCDYLAIPFLLNILFSNLIRFIISH